MMRRFTYLLCAALVFGVSCTVPIEAEAQWLGPHLEAQRHDNLRKRQQRQHERARARQKAKGAPVAGAAAAAISLRERQAAWRADQSEYRQRLLRDGRRSADRWLDQIVLRTRRR